MTIRTRRAVLAVALAVTPLAAAHAQPSPPPRVAVTRHEGTFNGQKLRYTATVSDVLLRDAAGAPAALATTIAYVRDDVPDPARRPVMFAFNGGPGASSSPLWVGVGATDTTWNVVEAMAKKASRGGQWGC